MTSLYFIELLVLLMMMFDFLLDYFTQWLSHFEKLEDFEQLKFCYDSLKEHFERLMQFYFVILVHF